MQISKQLSFIAEIVVLILLLLLIFNIYTIWVGVALAIVVSALIYTRIRSTQVMPVTSTAFLIKELRTTIDFKDDKGELVHVTKEQEIRPYKGTPNYYTDRGIAGTGTINNFESFVEINGKWEEIKNPPLEKTVEGAELAVTTYFRSPLPSKSWTKRKLEFNCLNCFTEKKETFAYRIDNPTQSFKITFNFPPNRKPKQIEVCEIISSYRKELDPIKPISLTKLTEFEWSKKKPPFGSVYLFIWKW